MNRDEYLKHEWKEIIFFIILGLLMTVIIPLYFGLGTGAWAESFVSGKALEFGDFLVTYLIYYIFIFGGLIGLAFMKIGEMQITSRKEHPANQSKPVLFGVAYIHDPEQDGLLYNIFDEFKSKFKNKNPMAWSLSILRCLVLAIVVFAIVGLVQSATNFSFTGIPQSIEQQITPAAEVFFGAEPPAFAETTLMILIFSILMSILAYFNSKFGWGKWIYFLIGGLIICPLIGLGWMSYHFIVYGNSAAALFSTFLFGFLGSLLTLLFGTFIFWYVWHFMNNFFIKLSEVATSASEDIYLFTIIILGVIITAWVLTELAIRKRKKQELESPS